MRKNIVSKVILSITMVLGMFVFTPNIQRNVEVEAKSTRAILFTLPALKSPAVEVVSNAGSTASVSNASQFITALQNNAINNIVFTANITLTSANINSVMAVKITRSLIIDGSGFVLLLQANGSNLNGSFPSLFNLEGATGAKTFHLKNIEVNKSGTADNGVLVRPNATSMWDIIFEDFKNVNGDKFTYTTNPNNRTTDLYDVFFRGNVSISKANFNIINSAIDIVIEPNAIVDLVNTGGFQSVFEDESGKVNTVSFGNNSKTTMTGGDGDAIMLRLENFYFYPGSDSFLFKASDTDGVNDSNSAAAAQKYYVDSNAKLVIKNNNGQGLVDLGTDIDFRANPNAHVEMIIGGGNALSVFRTTRTTSKMVIDSPKYINFVNTRSGGSAFSNMANTNNTVEIVNADIGLWDRNKSTTLPPNAGPGSPSFVYENSTVKFGNTNNLSTTITGFNASLYNRIATSHMPRVTADNVTVAVSKTKTISSTFSPDSATLSYSSSNTGIATVNSSGVVTGVSVGTTTVRVTATNLEGVVAIKDITVRVTNDNPVLTVNAFRDIAVGTDVDPLDGLNATDTEDGDITSNVVVSGGYNKDLPGVYSYSYSITDSNNNVVTKKQVILVNDGKYVVGNTTILYANNFSLRVGEVVTTAAAIRSAANAQLYSKITGDALPSSDISIANNGGYTAAVGTYNITFRSAADSTAQRTIIGNVTAGNQPLLSVPAYTEINVGDTFSPRTNVTATDVEDGDLTGAVSIGSSVDVNTAGVYALNYSVTDRDGNIATATQVVLVNNGEYKAGNSTIIKAKSFQKRVSTVNVADDAIKTAATVTVYSKTTGQVITEPTNITNNGGYSPIIGTYNLTFEVASDPSARISAVATVVAGDAPVLVTPTFTEINVGGPFNPLTGVSANDVEDGTLTVDVTGTVNRNVAGVYTLNYSIVDSDGNSASSRQVVVVNNGSYKVGTTYIIHANNFGKRISEVSRERADLISAANVMVYSRSTGQVLDTSNLNINYGTYQAKVGIYNITYSLVGDTNASITIDAEVTKGVSPVINVPLYTEITVGASFIPAADLSVNDTEDGNLTSSTIIDSNVNASVAGVYKVDYTVTDRDGNTSTTRRVVLVNDGTFVAGANFILKASDFTKFIGAVRTSDDAIKTAAGVKVYNKRTGEVSTENVVISSNGGYAPSVGVYTIAMNVAGDTLAAKSITATVISGNIPTITTPSFTEVTLDENFDVLSSVTATDIEDGNIIFNLTYSKTVDTTVAGVYTVEYTATDSDGNTANAMQVVLVNDGTYKTGTNNIIHAKSYEINVGKVNPAFDAISAKSDLKVYSKTTGQISSESAAITSLGGYTNVLGPYTISFNVPSDPLANISIIATAVTGELPVIIAPTFSSYTLNNFEDLNAGVEVVDFEDGTSAPTVVGDVDFTTAGVYRLDYSTVDSDGNIAEATRIVLVNDGSFVEGSDFILLASDFTIRVGEVSYSPNVIKFQAGIRVYSKLTGSELHLAGLNINRGSYKASVGTYDIEIAVAGDSLAVKNIVATVTAGQLPVIVAPTYSEITVGDLFNVMDGVSANDAENGDITHRVATTGTVNKDVPGVYVVDYDVTDTDGNKATLKRVVLVNDGTYDAGDKYIMKANSIVKRVSEVDTDDEAIKLASGFELYDKMTGLASLDAVTIDKGGYDAVVGGYTIEFTAALDATTKKSISADVNSGSVPTLVVPAFSEVIVGGPFDVRAGVSAADVEDGNITGNVSIDSNINLDVAGVYNVNYSITDFDGNTATRSQVVLVNDGTYVAGANFIINANDFTKRVGQVDTSDAAVKTAAIVKVYSRSTSLEVSEAVSVNNGGYSAVANTYNVTFTVDTDTLATMVIEATVVSGTAPTISAPKFTEITVGGSFVPSSGVTGNDLEDGSVIVNATDTVDTLIAGVYVVDYDTVDSDGNTATAKQVVLVNDGSFISGTDHIIKASDFARRISQVSTAYADLVAAADVKVYSKNTGLISSTASLNINLNTYAPVAGQHTIKYTVADDDLANTSIVATVSAGDSPVFDPLGVVVLFVGEDFDLLDNVVVTDTEDVSITPTFTGTYNKDAHGVYPIEYSATDSDGNTTKATRIVLVNDGNYNVGDKFIIRAESFTKRVGQVDLSDAAIKTAAGVKLFDLSTGLESSEQVDVENFNYVNSVGVYNVQFNVASDSTTFMGVNATVTAGDSPVINSPLFTETTVGGSFDAMSGVTVTDAEDGSLMPTYTSNVDLSVAGVYTVDYTVTDSDSNTTTAKQVVLVNDGSYVAGNTAIIKAEGFTKLISQVVETEDAIKTSANLQVYDKLTGNVSSENVLVNDGGYTIVANIYNVVFTVESDPSASKSINAIVSQGNIPVIVAPTFTEITVGDPFNPTTGVSANDIEDGILTVSVGGSVDKDVAGVYNLVYTVVDSDNNTTTENHVVLVNDGTYAAGDNFIIKANDFGKRIAEVNTDDDKVKMAAGVEVYSKTLGTVAAEAVTVDQNGYNALVGTYNITFTVASDVKATKEVVATVDAGDSVELTVPAFTEILVGDLFIPTNNVTATDTEDGDLIASVIADSNVDVDVAGVYTVDYTVEDSDGNVATAKQVVLVNDGSFVAGDNFLIHAEDFTKRVGQVDTSEAAVKTAANVTVYDKSTGLVVSEAVTVNNGGYAAVVNDYSVSFTVASDAKASITVTASVNTGDSPVLSVPLFTSITTGDGFNSLDGVSVTDTEDSVVPISAVGVVDTSIGNVYVVEYSATDSDGNVATARQVVLVNDGTFVEGSNLIIKASKFSKSVGGVDTSDTAVKTDADVKVFSKSTGQLTSEAVVVNKGGYVAVVGTYNISFTALNDSLAQITVEAKVVTGNLPILMAPTFTEITLGDSFDELAGVVSSDIEDGPPSVNVNSNVNLSVAGVYVIDYSVTDSDSNSAEAKQILLVNDGTFTKGSKYILQGNDFTKRVGQVVLSNIDVTSSANVALYSLTTGQTISASGLDVNYNSYQAAVGEYDIDIFATDDLLSTVSVKATVIAGNNPVINAPAFTEINVGDTFDELTSMTSTDDEDGNLTASVVVDSNVDSSVAGIYNIEYTITDSDRNTTTFSRVVLVNDGTFVAGDNFIINANSFVKRIGQVNVSDASLKTNADVKTFDKLTGNLVSENVLVVSNGGYSPITGQYVVTFAIENDALASINITASVVPGSNPEIFAPEFTTVNVGDAFDSLNGVSAVDLEDNDITSTLVVNGTVDTAVAGVYVVDYSVVDSDGNTKTAKHVVLVNDGTFVAGDKYIIKATSFTKRVSEFVNTIDNIKLYADVQVFDKFTGVVVTENVVAEFANGAPSLAGNHDLAIYVESDVKARISVVVTLIAGEAPVLTVPKYTEVKLGQSFDPLAGVSATDVEDLDITSNVVVSNTVNTNKAGIYLLNYSVTDADGNEATASHVVLVNDGKFVYDNDYIINANDFDLPLSKINGDDLMYISLAKVRVFDIRTSTWVINPTIAVDRQFVQNVEGKYEVTFSFNPKITVTANVYKDDVVLPPTGNDNGLLMLVVMLFVIGFVVRFVNKRLKFNK